MPIGAASAVGIGLYNEPQIRTSVEAAKAFEGMLLQQLFKSMSATIDKSGLFGNGFEAQLYSDMFMSGLADSAAGGLGMAELIQKSIDGKEGPSPSDITEHKMSVDSIRGFQAYRTASYYSQDTNANLDIASAAEELIGDSAERWTPEGELSHNELGAQLATNAKEGIATFNVADAGGYKGQHKCNLFAFELLRRAGYAVPISARQRGWGYPGADSVTKWAAEDNIKGWAKIRSGENTEALNAVTESGRALLITSSSPGTAAGHMAVADKIHSVRTNASGQIESVEYSGWDANVKGARYSRRTWRLNAGEEGRGFDRIEILEPIYTGKTNSYNPANSGLPGASIADLQKIASFAQEFASATDNEDGT